MSSGTGSSPALEPSVAGHAHVPAQRRAHHGPRFEYRLATSLDEAERARDHATARLRDAEHWRRLVSARLDLAVASVADIDDLDDPDLHDLSLGGSDGGSAPSAEAVCHGVGGLHEIEATVAQLRQLIGMPDSDGRLAESTLMIRLQGALGTLDAYLRDLRREVDEAEAHVAAWIVDDAGSLARHGATPALGTGRVQPRLP